MFGLPSLFPVGSLALPELTGQMALRELPDPKARRVLKVRREIRETKEIKGTLGQPDPL
jgi:hypothetical protein